MNNSASPSPPPGLGDHPGLRALASRGHHHHAFTQAQVAAFLPNDLASATALLQHYRMELQQQQQTSASLSSLPSNLNPRAGLQQAYVQGVAEASDDAAAGPTGLNGADLELQVLLEIASTAFVNNNRIDLSLLSFKQRLAFVSTKLFQRHTFKS